MVLKTSLIRSFSRVKCSIDLWSQSGFGGRIGSACLLRVGCPQNRSWMWSKASCGDFDFDSPSPGFTQRLDEAFIASSSRMYGWALERTSLILAALCFRVYLYREWVTSSLLMNASVETSSPQLEILVSWFWKKLMYNLRLSSCLNSMRRRWWLFHLASWKEAYWMRNASVTNVKLWIKRGGRE